MRLLVVWMLGASGFLRICGSEAPAPPPVIAPPPAPIAAPVPAAVAPPLAVPAPVAPAPFPTEAALAPPAPVGVVALAKFGGSVVPVGSQSVEVLPMSDGAVVAYVNDSAGATVLGGPDVSVRVQGTDQAAHPVALLYDGAELHYAGRVEAGVQIAPGPVEVTVTQAGQSQTGRLDMVGVVEPPQHGGAIVLVGIHKAEVIAKTDGVVQAFVTSSSGAAVDPSVQVIAKVHGADQTIHEVPLRFNTNAGVFEGHVAAGVQLVPGPVEVSVTAGGLAMTGRLETLALLPPPAHGGSVLSAGTFGVEVVPTNDGHVHAFVSDQAATPLVVDDGLTLALNVDGQLVTLVWDPAQLRFVGRPRTGIRGPVEVVVLQRGRHLRGRVARVVAIRGVPVPPIVTVVAPPPPVIIAPPPPVVRIPPPPVVRIPPPPVVVRPPPPPAVGIGKRPATIIVRPPAPPATSVDIRARGKRGGVQIRIGN